ISLHDETPRKKRNRSYPDVPRCQGSSNRAGGCRRRGREALLPAPPDRSHPIAPERPQPFPSRLARAGAPLPLLLRLRVRRAPRRRQGNAVEASVPPPLASPVESMTRSSSGRRLSGYGTGRGRQLRLVGQALAGPQPAGQGSGGEPIAATRLGSGEKSACSV